MIMLFFLLIQKANYAPAVFGLYKGTSLFQSGLLWFSSFVRSPQNHFLIRDNDSNICKYTYTYICMFVSIEYM